MVGALCVPTQAVALNNKNNDSAALMVLAV